MYLDKINQQWVSHLKTNGFQEHITITNTTKLNVNARLFMLELQFNVKRYHLYHCLDEDMYELRQLDEAYTLISAEEAFGLTLERSKDFEEAVHSFMLQHYDGIQTSVDCRQGLEKAKLAIQRVRL
ncbi:hypothetical protein BC351_02205 [Paenibacillus ferrarius]|uniref:Uncharacterized protein n=1 Tax=Paenibacillus ferrarius TaxID=1469647 RepID=A0A1V4HU75_9BACL|nr:hypothetical protein [Paenibacillus ferrarius]OPH62073.1 hypothetical protein BC351_02205 [Paenibacillus ferrarius]